MTSCVVGLDVGSTTTKAVVLDLDGKLLAQVVNTTGGYFEERARETVAEALKTGGCTPADIVWLTATGYGRERIENAQQRITELSCHGRGAYFLVPRKITVVDIGGQDNKLLWVDANGKRGKTKMNRKCAAGTGAFIESAAKQLGVQAQELQALSDAATDPVEIGSFCTVFAATEIIEHLRRGKRKDNIARGVLRAVALRVFEMGRFVDEVVMTGGVAAYFPGVARELETLSNCRVTIPPSPQTAGALGAALYALDAIRKGSVTEDDEPENKLRAI